MLTNPEILALFLAVQAKTPCTPRWAIMEAICVLIREQALTNQKGVVYQFRKDVKNQKEF